MSRQEGHAYSRSSSDAYLCQGGRRAFPGKRSKAIAFGLALWYGVAPMTAEKPWMAYEAHYDSKKPVRTLWMLMRGQRLTLLVAAALFLVKHSPIWVLPILFSRIIGVIRVPAEHDLSDLWLNLWIMAAIVLQNIPTHIAFTWFMSRSIRGMECRLRQALVRRLQQLSMGFHGEQQSGRLQSKVLRDVEAVQGLCSQLIDHGLSGVVGLAVAFGVTITKDPRTALLYVILIPLAVIVQRTLRNSVTKRNSDFRRAIEDMMARVSEMITMIPVTRAHGLESHEVRRVSEELDEVRSSGVKVDVTNAVFGSVWWVSMHSVQIVFLAIVGYRVMTTGAPTVEDVIMFWGFFQVILTSVSLIVNMYPSIARGFESIRSIGDVLQSPDIERNAGKRIVNVVHGAFKFDNVTFRYESGDTAVSEFSLEVSSGECVAFVGPSGAGKSTLVSLLIGFRRPTSGRILLDGVDMQDLDLRTYRRFIAVIPQETLLFSASIRDNITYGMAGVSAKRLQDVLDASNVSEFLGGLEQGLETRVGERGVRLSGGQRQRIAIARALVRDPQVIMLDEATSSLDVLSERFVQEAIDRLAHGRTTFIVAHRLSTIRRANRIVVMRGGRCVEVGTHEELTERKGEFYRLKVLQT